MNKGRERESGGELHVVHVLLCSLVVYLFCARNCKWTLLSTFAP